jgi:hypothetical protein
LLLGNYLTSSGVLNTTKHISTEDVQVDVNEMISL